MHLPGLRIVAQGDGTKSNHQLQNPGESERNVDVRTSLKGKKHSTLAPQGPSLSRLALGQNHRNVVVLRATGGGFAAKVFSASRGSCMGVR